MHVLSFMYYTAMYCIHTTSGFKCPEHENPADFFLDVLIASEDVSEESSTTDEAAVDKSKKLR